MLSYDVSVSAAIAIYIARGISSYIISLFLSVGYYLDNLVIFQLTYAAILNVISQGIALVPLLSHRLPVFVSRSLRFPEHAYQACRIVYDAVVEMEHGLLAAVNIAIGYARLVGKLRTGYRRVISAHREGALRHHFTIGSTLNEVSSLLYHSQVEGKAG